MGQRFFEDSIGTLTHSTGVISLTSSKLTIGGQQYSTSTLSRTISTDVIMTANTRYQIFAVVSSGVVALRISSNENSVGPSGFSAWKLVGSFYSDSMIPPAFGSFINIEGVPQTHTAINEANSPTLSPLISGFNTPALSAYMWTRIGNRVIIDWRLDVNSGIAAAVRLPLPRGSITTVENNISCGYYSGQNSTNNASGGSIMGIGSTDVGFSVNTAGTGLSLIMGNSMAPGGISASFTGKMVAQISQWSSKPIKDL